MKTYLARWENGDYSIVCGRSPYEIFDLMDQVGDPSGAVYVELPMGVRCDLGKTLLPEEGSALVDERTSLIEIGFDSLSGAAGERMIAAGREAWHRSVCMETKAGA